ncbi:MAG: hypothetical protein QM704_27730 [Anaeromyxobacteraceae bacterium]
MSPRHDEGKGAGIRQPEVPAGGVNAPADVPMPTDQPMVPGRQAEPDVHVPRPGGEPEIPGRIPDPEIPTPRELPQPGGGGAPERL